MRKNRNLKKYYDNTFSKKLRIRETSEFKEVIKELNWKGKKVLDVGCGTGEFAYLISKKHAIVTGIDYSVQAIKTARKKYMHSNLVYKNIDASTNIVGSYDVIVSIGTLEHMDNPFALLKKLQKHLTQNGTIVITSPNWINPRGFILMTLYYLFNAPITLADLHYFTPVDFINWAIKLDMNLKWRTIENSWAHGDKLIDDLKKRLPNVLADSGFSVNNKKISAFLKWINTKILPFDNSLPHSGAIGLYVLSQNNKPRNKIKKQIKKLTNS